MKNTSILIVTYNSSEFIVKCLESVYHAIDKSQDEVLIWDNNSSDDTVVIIETKFSEAKVTKSQKNVGFGKAINKLAKQATGEYIVILNPDTKVAKDWLTSLLLTFDENESVGAVNSKTKIMLNGEEFIQNAGSYVFYDGHARDRGAVITKYKKQLYEKDSQYYNKLTKVPAFSGVSVAMKRAVFLDLGGFDEKMFMYYEDTDLSYRMKASGYEIWYQPKSELVHIHSASSEEWSNFFVYHTELNRLLFVWKHFSLKRVFIETTKYKLSMLYQLIKLNSRFLLRLKVLFSLTKNLPYLLSFRWDKNI